MAIHDFGVLARQWCDLEAAGIPLAQVPQQRSRFAPGGNRTQIDGLKLLVRDVDMKGLEALDVATALPGRG